MFRGPRLPGRFPPSDSRSRLRPTPTPQVPPPHNEKGDKGGAKGGDNGDGKRSKFVVLQNTISAIHSLNVRRGPASCAPRGPPSLRPARRAQGGATSRPF